ncbi:MAG TPA: hypothetical protein VKZ18_18515 [Polyangia bacterium]|nr:hypothetical protein [Polyangia bacterium]
MANRQQAAPIPTRTRSGDGNTARVVVHKSSLPGWFWGVVGCLSVLGIGFAALLLVAKNGLLEGRPAGPSAPATAAAEPSAPAVAGGPQIEPLAPPNVAPPPAAEAKTRLPAHPIRLARTSSPGHAVAAPAAKADAPAKPEAPAAADDAPAAKKTPDQAAPVDDGRVHIHHTTASDDDDDDDSDN